jgi:hypothetical protein
MPEGSRRDHKYQNEGCVWPKDGKISVRKDKSILAVLEYPVLLKGYAEVGSDTKGGMHKCMGTNALID